MSPSVPGAGMKRRGALRGALLGGTLLAFSMPGVLPALGAWLVVPGLMALYALVTASARPLRDAYWFGCTFMAWFSWSIHHVLVPAYVAIVVAGGLYFVLGALALRWSGRWRITGFAAATAATFWLRAVMPEIHYPHGQPAHALFGWPLLLRGGIVLGGEPLVNAMLGAVAAAVVDCWRGWRVGTPSFAGARRRLAWTAAVAVLLSALGAALRTSPAPTATVDVAAVEPGLHPIDPYVGLDEEQAVRRYRAILEERLLTPTRELLAGAPAPDLVLWPESALPADVLPADQLAAGGLRLPLPGPWPEGAGRLLLGALVERDGRDVPGAFLVEPRSGAVLGHHEKLRLVPGGEFLPFARLLPDALFELVREAFREALGSPPDCAAGVPQPLLQTAGGHEFGALICYDNAFPGPAAALVADGARFLVVLSNEAWYRGGAELDQLVAMTVCRALEVGVPIVRCTTDGWSVAVDRDGGFTAALPRVELPTPAARILRVKVDIGPAAEMPLPSLPALTGPAAALWLLAVLLHGALAWARLKVTRQAPQASDRPGPRPGGGGTGS